MDRFLKTVDASSRLLEGCAVFLIYGFGALMLAEVFARGFLAQSLPYSWEYSTFAMASVFMLASGRAIRTATHVRVSLVLEAVSPKAARMIDAFANVIALIVVAAIGVSLADAFWSSYSRGLVSATVVRTPLAVPQVILLIGAIQLWFDLLARLIRRWTGRDYEDRDADALAQETADA
ncbi:TRAP transporter small permease subunit [Hoeflea prorocentri]|uniref:TRAP transporter small permease protein n=1 Tax=Hoeflea prorocentri TaxID=1922333 RepID=A0A9X3UIZ8_9HYPH|nr:TRAP transporter small permease [Hoeflea prorocentri]MCY6381685.1 TRAP transporter small permease [Hoeflea prorocentri]MDA5399485.1 TRAP transporter small permease [Hoeflea prorocentri]